MNLNRVRLLIIFVVCIAILGIVGTYVQKQIASFSDFKRASNANCQANRKNTEAFNGFIGTLQAVTLGSPLLTKDQRTARIAFYQAAKQPVPRCPAPLGQERLHTDPPPPPPTKPAPQLP